LYCHCREEFNERLFLLWIGLKEIIEEFLGLGVGRKMGGLIERNQSLMKNKSWK
jgi:hypothetical protein